MFGVACRADVRRRQNYDVAFGLVRTESILRNAQYFDMSNSESPQFTGRVIAALANDPDVMSKTGKVWVGAALAEEYGILDIDGKHPRPVTLKEL